MQNFIFQNATKIIFGKKTIPQIGAETAKWGKRVLLVYGRGSIKRIKVYDQVVDSLKAAGLFIIEHGGVRPNPVLSHVRQGITRAREAQADVVVAMGGGSVIDSAKAICAGAMANHDVWDFFQGEKPIQQALPLLSVLTLAATGSEMNGGMVVTNEETREKFGIASRKLIPRVSILDPETTFSVSPTYTVYGGVDAIAHCLEFYFTTSDPYTPVQDRLIEGLVQNVMEGVDRVLIRPDDFDARANLMWCATLALNGLTSAGMGKVGLPMHMIEHSLSALYDVPHGAGLSIVMPAWMAYQAQKTPRKFAQFGRRIFRLDQGGEKQQAIEAISCLKAWFARVNSPVRLSEIKVSETEIPRIAENALHLARVWQLREYSQEIIEEILRLGL